MHRPYRKITAQLLLFSFLLESCYNPNMGMGKQALPTPADPANKQRQYAGEPCDKYLDEPTSHIFTTADKHPITFTFHNGQWLAEVEEHAAHGSSQRRELPVVFERGLTLEDLVDSNPIEQKLLLHLCASQEEPDQPGYVYVGREPSQAKSQPQLLSSPAARQRTPPSAVGPNQQQATAQPQQAGSSPQQAQEQPGRQAVLSLSSPVQEIGEGPRSQGQLPTTPARVISKPLPAPSRETPRQCLAKTQPTSPQRAPSRRALSLRNQHELLHGQRAPQAKREQSAAMTKPANELAQPAELRQAIIPAPSLSDKAPPGIASHVLLAQGGHPVRFMHQDGQWQARVMERIGEFYRVWVLPVACQGHGDVAKAVADLQAKPTQYTQRRIHVMHTKQIPYVPQFVYLGAQGLRGGGNGADEPSGSGEPQDEPATGEPEGAQGKELPVASQSPAGAQEARQELKKYYQHKDFAQVQSLFEGEAPKQVDSLQCQLMLIEPVKVKAAPKDKEQEGAKKEKDDLSTHHEWLEWVKNPIPLEDLFKKRQTKPDGPEQEIQRLLLVGEPGTGKTTLSRKIASLWAQGKWGKEFQAVYVLPVRALQQSQYDNAHMRREATLPTAIANNCFAILPTKGKEYERLRDQISEELKQPTTLVVLDGLDEGAGASEALLREAKAGSHKLLMLSRPYGIEQERTLADIEIEHAGLSDGQMEAYVRGDLSSELGEELLQFIKEYPAIASIAHVPVNLQILCALWKDDGAGVREETRNGSLPGLYRRLTEYIWERYAKQWGLEDADCDELFDTLGKIALEAFEQGQVLISPELVRDHVEVSRVRDMLKDSGFLLLQSVGSQYQFPHLTFQEYFAGRALAKQLLSGNAEDQEEVQDFFSKHKYGRQYGVMLSFLSGEVSKEQGVEGLRKLLSQVQKEPQEVVGVQHVLLQMRLLNEWLCVAGADLEEELAALEGEFHVIASLKDWFGEGLDRVRREGDRKLLELLTTALQGSRAVAAHAPALLPPLRAACKDENREVRSAACSALAAVAKVAPALASQVLLPFLAACKDEDWQVRSAARSALVEVAKAAPSQVLSPLLGAGKDEDSWVRSAACSALAAVAKATPALASQVLEPLRAAGKDEEPFVRSAASRTLAAVAETAPELASQVLEPLRAAGKDEDSWVRSAARSALVEVAKAAPALASQVLEPLRAVCKDENYLIRSVACSALAAVAETAPALASQVLEPLRAAGKDEEPLVRSAACSALAAVAETAPALASQVLEPLRAAGEDEEWAVRSAACSALAAVAETAPALASQVLESLRAACKDEDRDARSAACSALAAVAKAAPALASRVLESLLAACKDEDRDARSAACSALVAAAKAVPAPASQVLESLRAAGEDEDRDARSAASPALAAVAKAAPELESQDLKPLRVACKNENREVRDAARSALVAAAKVAMARVLPPLLAACKDEDRDARSAASPALAAVAKAAPELTLQALEPLLVVCKDEDREVRDAASRVLAGVAKATPAQALEPLLDACKDEDSWVRSAACSALAAVAEAAPELASQALEPLLADGKDEDSWVRSAACSALAAIAKAAPELASQALEPLLADGKDEDSWVRLVAISALGSVVQAAPSHAPALVEPLLAACKDSDSYVRRDAREALGQFSLQQLIDAYWATQDQVLIPFIATRLYHTPLLVQTIPHAQDQRLVLYPTAGERVVWNKPHQEVQDFVQLIQGAAKQRQ